MPSLIISFRDSDPFYVTANAYFLSTKRRIKDTFVSSENAPKLTYSNLGAKKFSGVNPRTPNKGKERGGVGVGARGWGRGRGNRMGKENGRRGREQGCHSYMNIILGNLGTYN
jgi:hypothetical protein